MVFILSPAEEDSSNDVCIQRAIANHNPWLLTAEALKAIYQVRCILQGGSGDSSPSGPYSYKANLIVHLFGETYLYDPGEKAGDDPFHAREADRNGRPPPMPCIESKCAAFWKSQKIQRNSLGKTSSRVSLGARKISEQQNVQYAADGSPQYDVSSLCDICCFGRTSTTLKLGPEQLQVD